MVLLNLYSNLKSLQLKNNCKALFFFLTITSALQAEVIPFFNPTQTHQKNTATMQVQGFIANDPVSIKDFFDDWGGNYSPKDGDNIAMGMFRIDVGTTLWDDYYIGYFYQKDALIRANRGLVDGFNTIKNKIKVHETRNYDLALDMEGIERHGMLLNRVIPLLNSDKHRIILGLSAYLSYETDVQSGTLIGKGSISPDETYSATSFANYHFRNNLLYDGWNVAERYGFGYGFHLALNYENKEYAFSVNILGNDLFSRSKWNKLPYSIVSLKTENRVIGSDGYNEYDPTISGWEIYEDFTLKVSPKYHIDIQKKLMNDYILEVGYENIDYLHLPYISLAKVFSQKKVELLYEHRFHSIGISYADENFNVSIMSNGFADASAIGLSGSYIYQFKSLEFLTFIKP